MLKEEKNCRKDYLKKIKFYQDPLNTYTSDDCSEERSTYFYKPSFHCSQCYLIPFITLKENDNKVEKFAQELISIMEINEADCTEDCENLDDKNVRCGYSLAIEHLKEEIELLLKKEKGEN